MEALLSVGREATSRWTCAYRLATADRAPAAHAGPSSSRIVTPSVLGLGELRARARARHHVARLLRDAAGDLAAARLDRGLRVVAGEVGEGAGEHEGEPGQRGLALAAPPPSRDPGSSPPRRAASRPARGCARRRRTACTLSAITPPTPGTAASSSADAAAMASRLPSSRASAIDAVGPTWRMPRPTSSG